MDRELMIATPSTTSPRSTLPSCRCEEDRTRQGRRGLGRKGMDWTGQDGAGREEGRGRGRGAASDLSVPLQCRTQVCSLLLEAGADPDAESVGGVSPLMMAEESEWISS
eukprot:322760-Hanusia_phi.AAC.1